MREKLAHYKAKPFYLMLIFVGASLFIWGLAQQGSVRTNSEDNFSWLIWALGMILICTGATLPFWKLTKVLIFSLTSPLWGFCILTVLFWGFLLLSIFTQNNHHIEFTKNGVSEIKPALQITELYDDCSHSIGFTGWSNNRKYFWSTTAYFGGRYTLTMSVPISIESGTKGKMIGEPEFYLSEIEAIHSGAYGTSFSRHFNFDFKDWTKVYKAKGDYGVIGFKVKTGPPLKDFKRYVLNVK